MSSVAQRPLLRSCDYVCRACRRKAMAAAAPAARRRSIHQSTLTKILEAEMQWKERAMEIDKGERKSMLAILEERGLVNATTHSRDDFDNLLTRKRVGVYAGFDPTARSLHVGHMLPMMTLFWMYLHGFKARTLIGGGTARIGDPTGRLKRRDALATPDRRLNMAYIQIQLKKIWMNIDEYGRTHGYKADWAWDRGIRNNNVWLSKVSAIDLLKSLGSGMKLGTMLGRDTVKNKMESGDGMSFAEFSYPLLQAWDWWHMYNTEGIQVQIGGSDQYGNIIAGIDGVKCVAKSTGDATVREQHEGPLMEPMGLTTPLLTTSSGEKFGKSEGNAVWLDPEMTKPFDLYQYFARTPDADVERYLKMLTFLPLDKIAKVMAVQNEDASKRHAQHTLAREFLSVVHGRAVAEETAQEHQVMFGKTPLKGSPVARLPWQEDLPVSVILPQSAIYNQVFPRVLLAAGLVDSASAGHRLISQKGAYVGSKKGHAGEVMDDMSWVPITGSSAGEPEKYIFGGDTIMLRQGKWKIKICKIVSDEEFEKRGLKLDLPPSGKQLKQQSLEQGSGGDVGGESGPLKERQALPKSGRQKIKDAREMIRKARAPQESRYTPGQTAREPRSYNNQVRGQWSART